MRLTKDGEPLPAHTTSTSSNNNSHRTTMDMDTSSDDGIYQTDGPQESQQQNLKSPETFQQVEYRTLHFEQPSAPVVPFGNDTNHVELNNFITTTIENIINSSSPQSLAMDHKGNKELKIANNNSLSSFQNNYAPPYQQPQQPQHHHQQPQAQAQPHQQQPHQQQPHHQHQQQPQQPQQPHHQHQQQPSQQPQQHHHQQPQRPQEPPHYQQEPPHYQQEPPQQEPHHQQEHHHHHHQHEQQHHHQQQQELLHHQNHLHDQQLHVSQKHIYPLLHTTTGNMIIPSEIGDPNVGNQMYTSLPFPQQKPAGYRQQMYNSHSYSNKNEHGYKHLNYNKIESISPQKAIPVILWMYGDNATNFTPFPEQVNHMIEKAWNSGKNIEFLSEVDITIDFNKMQCAFKSPQNKMFDMIRADLKSFLGNSSSYSSKKHKYQNSKSSGYHVNKNLNDDDGDNEDDDPEESPSLLHSIVKGAKALLGLDSIEWQWESDRKNGTFSKYDAETSEKLEKAFQQYLKNKKKKTHKIQIGSERYVIDLSKMTQRNEKSSGSTLVKDRRIKRDEKRK